MGERWTEHGAAGDGTFLPDASLAGVVRQLLDEGRDARIALADNGEVILLPQAGRYLPLVRDMAAFCLAPADAFEIELIEPGSVAPGTAGRDVDELLWHAGFCAAQGRLPEGLSEFDVVQFTRWPNLSRLPSTPNAMRICALLVSHPTSIMMARRRLHVEAGEIRSIYAAAHLAGIAKVLNRKAAEPEVEALPVAETTEQVGAGGAAGPATIFGLLFNRISGI